MKKIYILLLGVVLVALGGCTQNNGHIGPIFGSWSLVGMTEDGEPLDLSGETIFSFQNVLVQVTKYEDDPYNPIIRYGNFTMEDDILTLKFQNKPTPTGSYTYVTPEWLHFPSDGNLNFDVKKLNGSKMELVLDNDGKIYEYSFKKTW